MTTVYGKLNNLLTAANAKTGESDTTLTDAVQTLIDGYGQGGGGYTVDEIAERTVPNGPITITLADEKYIGRYAFIDTPITELTIENNVYFGAQSFAYCKSLRKINVPKLQGIRSSYYNSQSSVFRDCTALEGIVFPSFGNYTVESYNFQNCSSLAYADFKNLARIGGSESFRGCTSLTTIIIRKTNAAAGLLNINNLTGTPFASGGTGGTLYVPSALISSYEATTNWSTILGYENNQILPIEGSYYETHYADGTVIE